VALKLGVAIVAAVTAAGGLGVIVQRPAPANRIRPVAPLVAPVGRATPPRAAIPVQRVVPRIRTVQVATAPRREATPRPKRVAAPVARTTTRATTGPTTAAAQPAAACDLGTLGICGLAR
jgi:hypothetical protein